MVRELHGRGQDTLSPGENSTGDHRMSSMGPRLSVCLLGPEEGQLYCC